MPPATLRAQGINGDQGLYDLDSKEVVQTLQRLWPTVRADLLSLARSGRHASILLCLPA